MRIGWIRCTVTMLVMATAPSASADEFSDFRIPAHRVTGWTAGIDLSANRLSWAYPGRDDRLRDLIGGVSSRFGWLADSDPTLTSAALEVLAFGQGRWDARNSYGPLTRTASALESRSTIESWRASLAHRRYPWETPLGFSVAAAGTGDYQQAWQHDHVETFSDNGVNRTHDVSRARSQQWFYRTNAVLDAMAGWGRVRDATGVYDARILEERLLESGAIGRPLSAGARRQMAALMVVRFGYSGVRDRPAKDLWAEVVRILRADGVLGEDGLEADDVLRAGELYLGRGITSDDLPRSPFPRLVGGFVGPSLSVSTSQLIARFDASTFSRRTVDGVPDPPLAFEAHDRFRVTFDQVLGGVSAEVHRPLGSRWQLDAATRAAVPLRSQDDGFEFVMSGSAYWMVSDRWVASASASQRRTVNQAADGGATREDFRQTFVALGLTWFIEDHLRLVAALQDQQIHGFRGFAVESQRSGSILVGLTYRLLGTFQAPDLQLGRSMP